ncbi:hypothetical protein DFJ73DRAFT_7154 [Zopfochytrium polystomum]|nr:hypothetical protein DFJ73DRAFT_7154 [Zopfochytrium polystomum]
MSTPLSNSISLTAQVTASSYWTEGPCENDVCNPSEVIDAQTASGINSGAGTRWVSKPDYINGTGSCSSQWINFNFASSKTGIVLNYANVQYGDTSDTFDGGFALNRRSCPNVSVAYNTVQDTFFELSAPDDYTCVIGSTIDNGVAERLDTISFKSSSKYNVNVKQLRFEWDTLVPRGSFGVKTCMMDVSEVRKPPILFCNGVVSPIYRRFRFL